MVNVENVIVGVESVVGHKSCDSDIGLIGDLYRLQFTTLCSEERMACGVFNGPFLSAYFPNNLQYMHNYLLKI